VEAERKSSAWLCLLIRLTVLLSLTITVAHNHSSVTAPGSSNPNPDPISSGLDTLNAVCAPDLDRSHSERDRPRRVNSQLMRLNLYWSFLRPLFRESSVSCWSSELLEPRCICWVQRHFACPPIAYSSADDKWATLLCTFCAPSQRLPSLACFWPLCRALARGIFLHAPKFGLRKCRDAIIYAHAGTIQF
jgi:hypothetical protein